jgi:carbamoyl-phosphate synthase large subunit
MSKVTGVPMVELAVRIALGERLADLGWPNGLLEPPPFVAVKAPAFSTAKLRGVDPFRRAGMQSTGEVIGSPRIRRWPCQGPDRRGPRPTSSRCRRRSSARAPVDRRSRQAVARAHRGGARAGRLRARSDRGNAGSARRGRARARPVARLGEAADAAAGETAILDLIASGEVRLVVNTPTPRSGAVRDAVEIRLAAIAEGSSA